MEAVAFIDGVFARSTRALLLGTLAAVLAPAAAERAAGAAVSVPAEAQGAEKKRRAHAAASAPKKKWRGWNRCYCFCCFCCCCHRRSQGRQRSRQPAQINSACSNYGSSCAVGLHGRGGFKGASGSQGRPPQQTGAPSCRRAPALPLQRVPAARPRRPPDRCSSASGP